MAEVGTSKNHRGGPGSHNKPIGCSASGAYAPGPALLTKKKKKNSCILLVHFIDL